MRSFKVLTILGFVLIAVLSLLIVGCGSDDTQAPTSNAGSLTDPEFVAVQEQIEALVDSTLLFALSGLGTIGTISAGGDVDPILYGPGFGEGDDFYSTYVNGWHVSNYVNSTSAFAFSFVDSVQFYVNGDIDQTGVNPDSLWYRHHWSFDVADKSVSYVKLEGATGFDFRGLNSNSAVVDGSNDLYVESQVVSQDSTFLRQFDFATEISNLTVNRGPSGWDQACPNSGTISSTINMTYTNGNALSYESEWIVTMSFNDGTAAVTVRSGGVVWSYSSDVCIALSN